MTRAIRNTALFAVLAAGVLVVGCGGNDSTSCATETPQINNAPSCASMAPNTQVQIALEICPTCNQTDAVCNVDLSAVSQNIIHLDPLVHACTTSNSCPPSCALSGVTCSFKTPAAPGTYTLYIGDSTTPVTFQVGGSATTCG
jgi:hypothetical protein